jgi:hypothetical protein
MTALRFVLKKAFSIDILAAAGSLPVLLFFVLVGHPLKTVAAHKVIIQVGFISV